jgi:hypothetical protein
MEVSCEIHAPAAALYRRLGGPHSRSGRRSREISLMFVSVYWGQILSLGTWLVAKGTAGPHSGEKMDNHSV